MNGKTSMFESLGRFTASALVLMTMGFIPDILPYSDGTRNQTFGSDLGMTDAEYAALMLLYTTPTPQPPTSIDPGMTDAEYAARRWDSS